MGSSSSKAKGEKKPEPNREVKKDKPVANVNNRDTSKNAVSSEKQRDTNTFITQPQESAESRNKNNSLTFNDERGQESRYEDLPNSETGARKQTGQNTFVWQADQQTQDELNEVLQIPTDNNRQSNRAVNFVPAVKQQDLPETYAQRKQRQQYTSNQQMLIREKTIYRNPDYWTEEEEEGDDNSSQGFDPSKFRTINISQPFKSTVFTTNTKRDETVQYMHGRKNMDEFDVNPLQPNSAREIELPMYNASEQDLMASLERDLM